MSRNDSGPLDADLAASLREKLARNAERRQRATREIEDARAELAALLRQGKPVLGVTEMARAAGINRERVYDHLRGNERKPRESYARELTTHRRKNGTGTGEGRRGA